MRYSIEWNNITRYEFTNLNNNIKNIYYYLTFKLNIIDLTKFQTKIDKDLDVHTITGLTDIIQDSVIRHPKFLELIETIVDNIETMNPKNVGFICNHGKHRSVAWAELIHKLYYKKLDNVKKGLYMGMGIW